MARNIATFVHTLTYTGFDGEPEEPPAQTTAVRYADGEFNAGGVGIPGGTNCDEEFEANFGAVGVAMGIEIHNRAYVDVAVRLDGGTSAIDTLVSGTKNITLHFAHGERLWARRNDDNGGDEGKLYVERISFWCVNVTSYGDSGVVDTDVSTVEVFNNAPMSLPDGGIITVAMPQTPQCSPISQAQIITTAQQPRAGAVGVKVFGAAAP